jgi:hypothetical protein
MEVARNDLLHQQYKSELEKREKRLENIYNNLKIIGGNMNSNNDLNPTLEKCEKIFNKKEDIKNKQIIALQKIAVHLDQLLMDTKLSDTNKITDIRNNIAKISRKIKKIKG